MNKLFKYLFCKPSVKVGDKLSYYNKTCSKVYFSWKDGVWFINCEDLSISWELEIFYRNKPKNEQ